MMLIWLTSDEKTAQAVAVNMDSVDHIVPDDDGLAIVVMLNGRRIRVQQTPSAIEALCLEAMAALQRAGLANFLPQEAQ